MPRTYSRQAVDRASAGVAAREEAVGEPDGAELEAAGGERLALLADEQLGRAAADVDEEQPPVEHRHRLQHAEVDQAGLLGAGDHLDVDAGLARGPGRGTRRRWPPRAPRWWRRRAAWRRSCRRCAASGAGRRCRARWRRAPAPSCRRRRGRGGRPPSPGSASRSGRRRRAGRRRGGSCSCRCRAPRATGIGIPSGVDDVSRRSGRVQAVEPVEHTLRGSWRSSRTRCRHVVGRPGRRRRRARSGSPRRGRRARCHAALAARRRSSGTIVATQAPVRQSSTRDRASPCSGLPSALCAASLHAAAEHVADGEVAEAVVEVAGERLVEEDLARDAGQ